jgi:hypothetical protein
MDEVRRDAQQPGPFAQSFADQSELKLLQVAKPPMDQSGRSATGADREIAVLDQGDAQSSGRRIQEYAASSYASAHHDEVPARVREEFELRAPGIRCVRQFRPRLGHLQSTDLPSDERSGATKAARPQTIKIVAMKIPATARPGYGRPGILGGPVL